MGWVGLGWVLVSIDAAAAIRVRVLCPIRYHLAAEQHDATDERRTTNGKRYTRNCCDTNPIEHTSADHT